MQVQYTAGKVVVAFIHPGQVSAYFMSSLVRMLLADQNGPRRIVGVLQEWSSANVAAARNSLTRQFLDAKAAEWLLWIDSDMEWNEHALGQLLESADREHAPIVGGLCFGMSQGKLFPTIYQLAETPEGVRTVRAPDYPRDQLVSVAATGGAFLLIHRDVIAKIAAKEFNPTFTWFQETEAYGQPVGEDLTFCLRALACGYPVHVDTRIKVGHHKSHLLTEDLFNSQGVS